MGESIVYVAGFILFGLLVIVPVVALIPNGRGKKQTVKDDEIRRLIDATTQSQKDIMENQERIMIELTQINERVTRIEKILKEVE